MEKLVATISNLVNQEDYKTLSQTVGEIDEHVNRVHSSLETFTSDHDALHEEEKTRYYEELCMIRLDIHRLRISLQWAVGGLLCSGIAILALCIHLIS